MPTAKLRSAPSGPSVEVLTPPTTESPDPNKFLNEAGDYITPPGIPVEQTSVLYVSGTEGNDENDGSEATPLATLARALELLDGLVGTYRVQLLTPSPNPDGYDPGLLKTRHSLPQVRICGSASEYHSDEVVPTSYAAYTFDFGEQGWAENEFRGMSLETISGASYVGQRRTILANTSSTITVGQQFNGQTMNETVFRVASPTVLIDCSPGIDGQVWGGTKHSQLFGGTASEYGVDASWISLEHCALNMPADVTATDPTSLVLAGAWMFGGTLFSVDDSDASAWRSSLILKNGWFFCGSFGPADETDLELMRALAGWGLVTETRADSGPRPPVRVYNADAELLCLVAASIETLRSARLELSSCALDPTDSDFPHAAVQASAGTYIFTSSGDQTVRQFLGCGASQYALAAERGGSVDWYSSCTFEGAGDFARTRGASQITLSGSITKTGAGAARLLAEQGGQIRLNGTDGSDYGDAVCSNTDPDNHTRAAGAWAVNEILDGPESSHIYRTS